jgi:hypothetical protein
VRLRLVLGVAVALVLGALALNMSRSAPRGAGSDHISTPAFVAVVPAGGTLCQPVVQLPVEAARVQLLIGTYGHPLPGLQLRFLDSAGGLVARGALSPGSAPEGQVTVPVEHVRRTESSSFCLHVGGHHQVALGGEPWPTTPAAESVDGHLVGGRVGLIYVRAGSESWWQVLPTIARRFGYGKSSLFGTWTLPVMFLLLLAVWAGTIRLLARELR